MYTLTTLNTFVYQYFTYQTLILKRLRNRRKYNHRCNWSLNQPQLNPLFHWIFTFTFICLFHNNNSLLMDYM